MSTEKATLSRWQGDDGYPTDAYFDAVDDALTRVGVTVAQDWRDKPWDYTFRLGGDSRIGYDELYVCWTVDPRKPGDGGFTGRGWHWAAWGGPRNATGDMSGDLAVDFLAEPEQVAAAVGRLVAGDRHG